jgi:ABC-2 type transport system ATP-binding protein
VNDVTVDGLVAAGPAVAEAPPDPPDPPAPAIRTTGLTKRYGSLLALDHLDLEVPRGAVFGLIGPNGAGKTTTFAIVATMLKSTAGRAYVEGFDTQTEPYAVRRLIGFMPDVIGVYDNLRVDEYLHFFASAYDVPRRDRPGLIDGLLELVDLTGKREAMVDSLSRGMKQRLSLARALVHDPEILILDEPASGLDPRARVELRLLVHQLRDMGKTIIVSSHILAELQEMCSHIGIMEAGRLLASGSPATILDQIGGGIRLRVRFADGTEETMSVASVAEQQELLRRLVADEGRDVVEFQQVGGGLEDLFLEITEGKVQ